jgi:SAM-dependent methyltransferase
MPRSTDERQDEPTTRLIAGYAASADTYARLWAPVIGRSTRRLLANLPLASARCVLDIGCGTGYLLPYLRSAAPSAVVVGVDITPGMLRHATAPGCAVAVMDARALGLRQACVDAAVAAFMLFHIPAPDAALKDARRVLRPGGWFGATAWATRRVTAAEQSFSDLLDRAGAPPEPPDPSRSDDLLNTPDKLVARLQAAGFTAACGWLEPLDHHWQPDKLTALLTRQSAHARRLAQLPPDRETTVIAELQRRVAAATADELVDRSEVAFAVGRRPPR